MRRRAFLALAGAALAAGFPTQASSQAQNWPERTVKLIVPYAAGGASDSIARPWADKLSQAFGQQFVVENRGGASGMIGAEAAGDRRRRYTKDPVDARRHRLTAWRQYRARRAHGLRHVGSRRNDGCGGSGRAETDAQDQG